MISDFLEGRKVCFQKQALYMDQALVGSTLFELYMEQALVGSTLFFSIIGNYHWTHNWLFQSISFVVIKNFSRTKLILELTFLLHTHHLLFVRTHVHWQATEICRSPSGACTYSYIN